MTILALATPITVRAAGVPSASARACFDEVEARAAKLVDVVHAQIRTSIATNLEAKTSNCSGPFVCAGGPNDGTPCASSADCAAAPDAFECRPQTTAGIAGAIGQAEMELRAGIAATCSAADLSELYGTGNAPCRSPGVPQPFTAGKLADCILSSTVGEIGRGELIGTVGGVLAPAAPAFAVDNPIPVGLCGVTLGGRSQTGSAAAGDSSVTTVGFVEPLLADGCTDGNPVCATKGVLAVGTMVGPPQQIFAGLIPVCILSTAEDIGNGTPQSGSINLATGEQHARVASDTAILIGTLCPICDAVATTCAGGLHSGMACSHPGETDVACPPLVGFAAIYRTQLEVSTESQVLAVPANNPTAGVTNPVGTFCGSCDADDTIGCTKDQDCAAVSACAGGVSHGCCEFSSNSGAFGEGQVTVIQARGERGPFITRLAGLSCIGRTGSAVVDSSLGLPGPARRFDTRLNALRYDTTPPAASSTTPPTRKPTATPTSTSDATVVPTATSTLLPTLTATSSRTPSPTLTPTPSRTSTPTRTRTRTRTRTATRTPHVGSPCGTLDDCGPRCAGNPDPQCMCRCKQHYCICSHECVPQQCEF